jgi:hypothetical protein
MPILWVKTCFKPKEKPLTLNQTTEYFESAVLLLRALKKREIVKGNLTEDEMKCFILLSRYFNIKLKPNLIKLEKLAERKQNKLSATHINHLIGHTNSIMQQCAENYLALLRKGAIA